MREGQEVALAQSCAKLNALQCNPGSQPEIYMHHTYSPLVACSPRRPIVIASAQDSYGRDATVQ